MKILRIYSNLWNHILTIYFKKFKTKYIPYSIFLFPTHPLRNSFALWGAQLEDFFQNPQIFFEGGESRERLQKDIIRYCKYYFLKLYIYFISDNNK